ILAEGRGPLRDASVEVYRPEDAPGGEPLVLKSDEQGHVFLGPFVSAPELGDQIFAFQVGTFPPESVNGKIDKEAQTTIEVALRSEPSVTVTGAVRSLEGLPVPEVELRWRGPGGPAIPVLWCVTDDQGRFERPGLSPGEQQVKIASRRFRGQLVTTSSV